MIGEVPLEWHSRDQGFDSLQIDPIKNLKPKLLKSKANRITVRFSLEGER